MPELRICTSLANGATYGLAPSSMSTQLPARSSDAP